MQIILSSIAKSHETTGVNIITANDNIDHQCISFNKNIATPKKQNKQHTKHNYTKQHTEKAENGF